MADKSITELGESKGEQLKVTSSMRVGNDTVYVLEGIVTGATELRRGHWSTSLQDIVFDEKKVGQD